MMVKLFSQSPSLRSSVGETVTSPLQASVAVKSTGAGTSSAHCTSTSAGGAGVTGGVSSVTDHILEYV